MININDVFDDITVLNTSFKTIQENYKQNNNLKNLDEEGLKKICDVALKTNLRINEALSNPNLDEDTIKKFQSAAEFCQVLKKQANELLKVAHKIIVQSSKKTSIVNRKPETVRYEATDTNLEPTFFETSIEKLTPKILEKQINRAYGYLFASYGKKQKEKYQKEKVKILEKEILNIYKQIESLKKDFDDVVSRLQVHPNDKALLKKMNVVEQSLVESYENAVSLEEDLALTKEKVKNSELIQAKGYITRNLLTLIGGERVSLKTIDNVALDATFLSADKFRQELKINGAQLVKIKKTFPNGEFEALEAISFDIGEIKEISKKKEHILFIIEKLNCLTKIVEGNVSPGFGWCYLGDNGKILITRDEHLLILLNDLKKTPEEHLIGYEDGTLKINPDINGSKTEMEFKPFEVDEKGKGGTVILTSGNAGVYEMHKSEALAFLSRGMNVMLFNFRGYGLSEGIPSKQGFHRDMQAAYEWVKDRTGQSDSKILFKALCLSGGAAAYTAAQHPDTNIFLDQTYSSMEDLVKEQLDWYVDDYVNQHLTQLSEEERNSSKVKLLKWAVKHSKPLAKKIAGSLVPSFEVASNLSKNNGRKALFYVHDDTVTIKDHLQRNMEELAKKGKLNEVSVYGAPGEHATSWVDVFTTPSTYLGVEKELSVMDENATNQMGELRQTAAQLDKDMRQEIYDLRFTAANLENELNDLKALSKDERFKETSDLRQDAETLEKGAKENVARLQEEINEIRKSKSKDKKALEHADELEKLASNITEETLKQVNELRDYANKMDLLSNEDEIKKVELEITAMLDKANALEVVREKTIEQLEMEVVIEKQVSEKKTSKLKSSYDPVVFKHFFPARNQVDHFLRKAKLSDDIIKL